MEFFHLRLELSECAFMFFDKHEIMFDLHCFSFVRSPLGP